MFRLISQIPRPLGYVAGGSACVAMGYMLGSQQPSMLTQPVIKQNLGAQASLRESNTEDKQELLKAVTPLNVNLQTVPKNIGISETITAANIAAELADYIVPTHTNSIREPLEFKLLFDTAKIIRQSTLKNDGSRYRAFVNLCTELKQRHGHELINAEFVLLTQLIFDEINIAVPQNNIKTAEQEAQMLKRVASTVWKKHYPTRTLPEWLVDIGKEKTEFISNQQLPEKLISRLDEERDKSNAQQMAANLYNAGLADIATVASAYESPLLQLQHYLTLMIAQPSPEIRPYNISSTIDFYQIKSPYHPIEDFFAVNQLTLHQGPGTLISLCDGHGGSHVASYLIKNFPDIFATVFSSGNRHLIEGSRTGRDPSKPGQLMKGIEQACQYMQHRLLDLDDQIDRRILSLLSTDSAGSAQANLKNAKLLFETSARDTGSTALFVLDYQGSIVLFHVGDTRATIVKTMMIEGENRRVSIAATEDHKPEIPRVYRHISKFGGIVSRKDEDAVYRVDGILAVGRAFGDHHCFAVQPIPTVTKLPPGIDSLILGSDGLWDVIPSWAAGPLLDIFDHYFDSPAENSNQEKALLDETVANIMQDISINKLGFDDPQLRKPDIENPDQLKVFLTELKHNIKENKTAQRDAFVLAQLAQFLGSEDDITVVVLSLKTEQD